MTDRLPLFPLGTVLLPGLVLPLHVFEPRYRRLVQDLLALPADAPRHFGVVAVREGTEVGDDGARALHEVGCVAELREVEALDDGRFDVVTVGTARFRLGALDRSLPYLTAEVEPLPEDAGGDETALLSAGARTAALFADYRAAVLGEEDGEQLAPMDPRTLSYAVAAAVVLDVGERQRLLETGTDLARLTAEAALLRREAGLLRAVPSLPALDLLRSPVSLN